LCNLCKPCGKRLDNTADKPPRLAAASAERMKLFHAAYERSSFAAPSLRLHYPLNGSPVRIGQPMKIHRPPLRSTILRSMTR
jgi:hypothetical protein